MSTTGTARRLPTCQGSRVKVKKDGQVKEVRIVFWVDFEEIDTTCGMTQKGE